MPRRASARGREPATSARPPVLRNGATSEPTKRTLSGGLADGGGTIEKSPGNGRAPSACLSAAPGAGAATASFAAGGFAADEDDALLAVGRLTDSTPACRGPLLAPGCERWTVDGRLPLRLGGVDAVVDVREDVVLCFNARQEGLVHRALVQFFVKPGETDDVFV